MIADNCELTLVTEKVGNGKSRLVLAFNGVVIPHQRDLFINTNKSEYDTVSVIFVLAPKTNNSDNKSLYLKTVEHSKETLQSI